MKKRISKIKKKTNKQSIMLWTNKQTNKQKSVKAKRKEHNHHLVLNVVNSFNFSVNTFFSSA